MRSMENPHAGQGPVLLDVGGDVGALLVTMPASLEGVEIEIRPQPSEPEPDQPVHSHPRLPDHGGHSTLPDHGGQSTLPDHGGHSTLPDSGDHSRSHGSGDHSHLSHVEVLPRPTPAGMVSCAVFPELTQGRYELYERPSGPVRLRVSITGGEVTQAFWPPDDPTMPG